MNAQTKAVRVLLVDDNPSVHRHVLGVLPKEFEVVDTLEDGLDVLPSVLTHQPELLILDITLRAMSGIAVASQLKAVGSKTRIVFLTVHDDADYAREAFSLGAWGYVLKMRLATDLEPALNAALVGKRFVSPPLKIEDVT